MKKLICLLLVSSFSTSLYAEACWKLYEEESARIQKEKGHDTYVGGQVTVQNGKIGYYPGIKVAAKIDNWARDLIHAIKWGPIMYPRSEDEPRREWLEAMQKSIKSDCPIKEEEQFNTVRAMMTELMNDGSFCPENKMLEPGFWSRPKEFKKILKAAVKDNRFPQYCMGKFVQDDSSRDVKEVSNPGRAPTKKVKSREE